MVFGEADTKIIYDQVVQAKGKPTGGFIGVIPKMGRVKIKWI
jgi:hypothetical protein